MAFEPWSISLPPLPTICSSPQQRCHCRRMQTGMKTFLSPSPSLGLWSLPGGAGCRGVQTTNKQTKRCSASLAIMEMYIKSTVRPHFTHTHTHAHARMTRIKKAMTSMWRKWWRYSINTLVVHPNVKHRVPYYQACPLLDIQPREMKVYVHPKCVHMCSNEKVPPFSLSVSSSLPFSIFWKSMRKT